MRLPDFEYKEPDSIQELALFLKDHGEESKIMAGGTDLLPSMKQRVSRPTYVVSLGNIPGLDYVDYNEEYGLSLGALVRLHRLAKDPLIIEKYPAINQAAKNVGSLQLRNMGTLGGNLCLDTRCWYYNQTYFWRSSRPTCIKMGGNVCNAVGGGKKCFAVFSGDLAPPLIAMGARVKLVSQQGERDMPLYDLFTGDGANPIAISDEEIITSVELPKVPERTFSLYLKYRVRNSLDFPLAGLALRLCFEGEKKVCRDVRIVMGAVDTRPLEVESASELLEGEKLDYKIVEKASDLAHKEARPVDNLASSRSYRKLMIKTFVKRALIQAMEGTF